MNTGCLAQAAEVLWGPAGAYAYAAYQRLRAQLFPELASELPIVIGLTAYGHCIGLTRAPWEHGARISLAPKVFAEGERMVDDVLIHEMLHAALIADAQDPRHTGEAWYAGVRRLSPAVLRHPLDVQRPKRRSVRIPNPAYGPDDPRKTLVRKVSDDTEGLHAAIARWPVPFRPEGYDFGPSISLAKY